MKKFKFYSFASALMLASAVGLGACSSDSDVNGGDSGTARDVVKTQFAINVPRANGGTRATGSETQGDGTSFLGMQDIWLLSFESTPNDNSESTSVIPLSDITAGDNSSISANQSSKVYENIEVKTGTSDFILYGFGKVADKKVGAFEEKLDLNGANTKKLSDISFKLEPIKSEINYEEGDPAKIIAALNMMNEKWKDSDENMKALHAKLQSLKAGSAESVRLLFQDIYDYVDKNYAAYPTAIQQLTANIKSCAGFNVENKKVTTTLTFPRDLNLPDGAVTVKFENGKFAYNPGTGIDAMNINPTSITYPALLSYYTSTPIYTSETRVNEWPKTTTSWKDDAWTGWTKNAKVNSKTAAIALKDNIVYGVASLKLQVSTKAASLEQNDAEEDTNVPVPSEGFNVRGILIGNQPEKVNYKFAPTDEKFNRTIWDSKVNLQAKYGSWSEANYTIVLPNQVAGNQQKDVHFALELENNSGIDFKGADGVIKNGAKFYLIGTLNPKTLDNVTNLAVFMSDYQTEVKASISSLAKAYNCIPDIRTTSLQLGLSVDLTWKEGFKYDMEIGGE